MSSSIYLEPKVILYIILGRKGSVKTTQTIILIDGHAEWFQCTKTRPCYRTKVATNRNAVTATHHKRTRCAKSRQILDRARPIINMNSHMLVPAFSLSSTRYEYVQCIQRKTQKN